MRLFSLSKFTNSRVKNPCLWESMYLEGFKGNRIPDSFLKTPPPGFLFPFSYYCKNGTPREHSERDEVHGSQCKTWISTREWWENGTAAEGQPRESRAGEERDGSGALLYLKEGHQEGRAPGSATSPCATVAYWLFWAKGKWEGHKFPFVRVTNSHL